MSQCLLLMYCFINVADFAPGVVSNNCHLMPINPTTFAEYWYRMICYHLDVHTYIHINEYKWYVCVSDWLWWYCVNMYPSHVFAAFDSLPRQMYGFIDSSENDSRAMLYGHRQVMRIMRKIAVDDRDHFSLFMSRCFFFVYVNILYSFWWPNNKWNRVQHVFYNMFVYFFNVRLLVVL